MIPLRFTVSDMTRANAQWGANCGPGALAAIAGLSLDQVRPLLGDFEGRGYLNPTMVFDALERAGLRFTGAALGGRAPVLALPRRGLARIQWEGPWMAPGVPVRARYRWTHWIAAVQYAAPGQGSAAAWEIFDINAMEWIGDTEWRRMIVPELTRAIPRATGGWHITHAIEVEQRSARAA